MGGSCSLDGEKCGDLGVKPKVLWDFNEKQEITDTRSLDYLQPRRQPGSLLSPL